MGRRADRGQSHTPAELFFPAVHFGMEIVLRIRERILSTPPKDDMNFVFEF